MASTKLMHTKDGRPFYKIIVSPERGRQYTAQDFTLSHSGAKRQRKGSLQSMLLILKTGAKMVKSRPEPRKKKKPVKKNLKGQS